MSHCRYCMPFTLLRFYVTLLFFLYVISFFQIDFRSTNESTLDSRSFTQSSMLSNSLHRPRFRCSFGVGFGPDRRSRFAYNIRINERRSNTRSEPSRLDRFGYAHYRPVKQSWRNTSSVWVVIARKYFVIALFTRSRTSPSRGILQSPLLGNYSVTSHQRMDPRRRPWKVKAKTSVLKGSIHSILY